MNSLSANASARWYTSASLRPGAAVLLVSFTILFVSFDTIGRYVLVFAFLIIAASLVATRGLQRYFVSLYKEKVCFIGSEEFQDKAVSVVRDNNWLSHHFEPQPVPHLSSFYREDIAESGISEVIVHPAEMKNISSDELLSYTQQGIKVTAYADFIELNKQSIPIDEIDSSWIVAAQLDRAHPYYNSFKRLIDMLASFLGLVITSPLLLLLLVLVRLESPGSPLYSQTRSGRFGVPFKIYKIRTMGSDAESSGVQWAQINDTRVTRLGAILRKTRLDEIPQLWNVLIGEMSIVGPRPERPVFNEKLERIIPFYNQRHLVKPGITGWAQINYPYGASVEDARAKLSYDLYYIKNVSWALDFHIMLRTVGTIAAGSR